MYVYHWFVANESTSKPTTLDDDDDDDDDDNGEKKNFILSLQFYVGVCMFNLNVMIRILLV